MRCGFTYLFGLFLLFLVSSCRKDVKGKDGIDWTVTLDHEKRTPYASSIVFESLPHYFPSARREPISRWFRYSSIDEHMYAKTDSANLLVLLGLDCFVSDAEWLALLKYAKAGHEVFLLSSNLDRHIQETLHCSKISAGREANALSRYNGGEHSKNVLRLLPDSSRTYGYFGRAIGSYFLLNQQLDRDPDDKEESDNTEKYEQRLLEAAVDTTPTVLGLAHGEPNFLRYNVGEGHITLHAAPLVMSNYFLLQPGNRSYLDSIWHSFPANISTIYWNEYLNRSTQSSHMSILLKYPATRWALIIAACTLLLYVLFGLKRMQRIVPVIPTVENASVSFVETVGRLYFNKGVHGNMAEKMIQHFLEWVRTYYYLDTTRLNDNFTQHLAAKSGRAPEEVASLINQIHNLRLSATVTAEQLHALHRSIQSFYKVG